MIQKRTFFVNCSMTGDEFDDTAKQSHRAFSATLRKASILFTSPECALCLLGHHVCLIEDDELVRGAVNMFVGDEAHEACSRSTGPAKSAFVKERSRS